LIQYTVIQYTVYLAEHNEGGKFIIIGQSSQNQRPIIGKSLTNVRKITYQCSTIYLPMMS